MAVKVTARNIDSLKTTVTKSEFSKSKSKALPVTIDINQPGRLRVGHLLSLFGVSHAGLYKGLGTKFPKPDGNDGRPYWNTRTIVAALG